MFCSTIAFAFAFASFDGGFCGSDFGDSLLPALVDVFGGLVGGTPPSPACVFRRFATRSLSAFICSSLLFTISSFNTCSVAENAGFVRFADRLICSAITSANALSSSSNSLGGSFSAASSASVFFWGATDTWSTLCVASSTISRFKFSSGVLGGRYRSDRAARTSFLNCSMRSALPCASCFLRFRYASEPFFS